MRAWHWRQTQQELTRPVVPGSGWAEFFIEWLRFWVELDFTNIFEHNLSHFFVGIHLIKEDTSGYWGQFDTWCKFLFGFGHKCCRFRSGQCQISVPGQTWLLRQSNLLATQSEVQCPSSQYPISCPMGPQFGHSDPVLSQHSINVQSASVPLANRHHMGLLSAWPAQLTLIVKQCEDLTSVSQHRY